MLTSGTAATRTLTIATLAWIAAMWYCKTNFYRDPGSAFFDEKRAFAREYSMHRKAQSISFLEKVSEHSSKAAESPSLCATFLTVKRTGEQPLNVSFGLRIFYRLPEDIYAFLLQPKD
jgi:hypothetical protein